MFPREFKNCFREEFFPENGKLKDIFLNLKTSYKGLRLLFNERPLHM
jgi:hypothetical protein